jgi:hypothetical protein
MPIDPGTATVVGAGLTGLAGMLGGGSDRKLSRQQLQQDMQQFLMQLMQRQHEFSRGQGLTEGQTAVGLERQIDSAPLRDELMFALKARAGLSPRASRPNDMFNPGPGGYNPSAQGQPGGIDLDQLAAKRAGYKHGQGGVTTDVAQALMDKLGYGRGPTGQTGQGHAYAEAPNPRKPIRPSPVNFGKFRGLGSIGQLMDERDYA